MSRTERKLPVELAPVPWPDAPSEDVLAEVARIFAVRLRDAIGSQSMRSVAAQAGINHNTILKILAGQSWPDLSTIARLERTLGVELYSSAPLVPRGRRTRRRGNTAGS